MSMLYTVRIHIITDDKVGMTQVRDMIDDSITDIQVMDDIVSASLLHVEELAEEETG